MTSEHSRDSRILIVASGGKFLPNSHSISAYITKTFTKKQCKEGHTWRYVNVETKTYYWEKFVKKYRWDLDHDVHIRETWKTLAADLYRKTICNWRAKSQPPIGVNLQIWNKWKDIWSTSKWQEKSNKAKKNRNTEPEGPGTGLVKHTGGSRCFVEHSIKMREELNCDTTAYELFKKLHQKKDSTWVDAKSNAVDDKMNERLLEASQPDVDGGLPQTPTLESINEMYIQAAGGVKRNRLYGIGSQAFVTYYDVMSKRGPHARTSSSADVVAARAEAAASNSKVKELTQELINLQEHVKYLTEHVLINPRSHPSSIVCDDDTTQAPSSS
ncbi:uncharacterized protein [Henckelia pumila]|uniref:uncharacterized protein n=1 Tax=Henckelia pumila TaxID=405737 RepID=UPI003C6DDA7E